MSSVKPLLLLDLDDVLCLQPPYGGAVRHWVAISHDEDGWPEDPEVRKNLVRCDGEVGVTDAAVVARIDEALAVCKP